MLPTAVYNSWGSVSGFPFLGWQCRQLLDVSLLLDVPKWLLIDSSTVYIYDIHQFLLGTFRLQDK